MAHHQEQDDAVRRRDVVPVLLGQRRSKQACGQQCHMYNQKRNIGNDLGPATRGSAVGGLKIACSCRWAPQNRTGSRSQRACGIVNSSYLGRPCRPYLPSQQTVRRRLTTITVMSMLLYTTANCSRYAASRSRLRNDNHCICWRLGCIAVPDVLTPSLAPARRHVPVMGRTVTSLTRPVKHVFVGVGTWQTG